VGGIVTSRHIANPHIHWPDEGSPPDMAAMFWNPANEDTSRIVLKAHGTYTVLGNFDPALSLRDASGELRRFADLDEAIDAALESL
jgi:hypothetical protein